MSTDFAPVTGSDRRRLQTRAAVLEAGRRLYSDRAAGEVTIQEITGAADVAKGSFYNHFESREDRQRTVAAAAEMRFIALLLWTLGIEANEATMIATEVIEKVGQKPS